MGAVLNQMDAGARKEAAQKGAIKYLIAVGVGIFIGFTVSASAKPGKANEAENAKTPGGTGSA